MVALLVIFGGPRTWELEEEVNLELKQRHVSDQETPQPLMEGSCQMEEVCGGCYREKLVPWRPDLARTIRPGTSQIRQPWALSTTTIQNSAAPSSDPTPYLQPDHPAGLCSCRRIKVTSLWSSTLHPHRTSGGTNTCAGPPRGLRETCMRCLHTGQASTWMVTWEALVRGWASSPHCVLSWAGSGLLGWDPRLELPSLVVTQMVSPATQEAKHCFLQNEAHDPPLT